MRKFLLLLTAVICFFKINAQDSLNKYYLHDYINNYINDYRWCFDLNIKSGVLSQDIVTPNLALNYQNSLNNNIGKIKFTNGQIFGFEGEIGYFFGEKRHFGIGAGINYLSQNGSLTLDKFHVEYQSLDMNNDIFRQLITAEKPINESITTTNFNVPLVLKYKTRISKRFGFSADAGIVCNLQIKNSYSTNAIFDYEAIYKYAIQNDGSVAVVYDNTPVPPYSKNDLLLTAAGIQQHHGNINQAFDSLNLQGYNVKLGSTPGNTRGTASYTGGSVGFIFQPTIYYILSDVVSLNLGFFYIYQSFSSSLNNSYKLTDKIGQYSSLVNSVSASNNYNYGFNIGVRLYFGKHKPKDSDNDGVPDNDDRCPFDSGLVQFQGCPDSDGDGIPDYADSCPHIFGIAKFLGCPDTDGDGIPDKDDACPYEFGLIQFHGCADTDGDGVPDKDDACPTVSGPIENHGCPYLEETLEPKKVKVIATNSKKENTKHAKKEVVKKGKKESKREIKKESKKKTSKEEGKVVAKNIEKDTIEQKQEVQIKEEVKEEVKKDTSVVTPIETEHFTKKEIKSTLPISYSKSAKKAMDKIAAKQIKFEFGKFKITKSSRQYLNKVAKLAKTHPDMDLYIDGYSDKKGSEKMNKKLSKLRANLVKRYLVKKGISPKRIITIGHGSKSPIANNRTKRGRALNRRVTLRMKKKIVKAAPVIQKPVSTINLFANKEKGSFTIILTSNKTEEAKVVITDKNGKNVMDFNILSNTPTEFLLDVPAGMYIFTVKTETSIHEEKIVVTE